ncbi:MAG: murein biosynthesis integral membrane protein MurJ [bacterium]|nr:murein biosynthesis integral membrane protein MurJ [bacterium]
MKERRLSSFERLKRSPFISSIFSTSLFIGISRITGFLRELVFSSLIGTSYIMDAFVVAFMVPNFFRRILGEKAAESVFIPLYIREREKSQKDADSYMSNLFTIIGIILIAGTILFYIIAPYFIKLVAPGFNQQTFTTALYLTMIILPYMFFIGIYAFTGSLLESFKKFNIYNIAPLVFNITLIASVLIFYREHPLKSIGLGVLIGVILETLFLFIDLRKLPSKYNFRADFKDPRIKKTFRLLVPILGGSGIEKLAIYIDRIMASLLNTGAISALHFSFLLTDLPFAVFSIAISKVIHPYISEKENYSSKERFSRYIRRGIFLNVLVLLPVTIIFIIFARQIVQLVYMRGAFDSKSVELTISPFIYYTLGLIPMGLVQLYSKAFYSLLNTKTPLYAALISTLINILCNIILMPRMGAGGLALGTSISVWFNAAFLFFKLKQRISKI